MPNLAIAALILLGQVQAPPPAQEIVTEIRGLVQTKQWAQLDARLDAVPADDPAWERLPSVVYTAAVARQELSPAIARLARVAAATSKPSNKASALIAIARAYRRQGEPAIAVRALQDAKAAAPGTALAEEAVGLIYEIEHLSPGLAAPPISAKARHGQTISLAQLRGKPVVLVFWGTT
jgi:hypothetical protein